MTMEEKEEKKEEQKIAAAEAAGAEDALGRCARERDEYLNGWKRAKADLANYRKEEEERFSVFAQFSTEASLPSSSRSLIVLTWGSRR